MRPLWNEDPARGPWRPLHLLLPDLPEEIADSPHSIVYN
jgi:hypothetical protein